LNFRTSDWYGFRKVDDSGNFADDYDQAAATRRQERAPVISTSPAHSPTGRMQGEPGPFVRGGGVILYDNPFVGDRWRQHEQTYDAGYFQQKLASGLDFQLAYVWQVNRIFGNDVPAGTNDNQTWLANLAKDWAMLKAERLLLRHRQRHVLFPPSATDRAGAVQDYFVTGDSKCAPADAPITGYYAPTTT
jgi:hypothetical protein